MRLFPACLLTLSLCLLPLAAAPAAPDWVADAGNSKWIVYGGEKGVAEENGLYAMPGGEGAPVGAERGGVACAQSLRPDGKPGYFYIKADAWNDFRVWQGDHDLLLTLRYWDGAPGQFLISYDSSDPRVRLDPNPPGAWRRPEAYPESVKLAGTKTWKTLTVRLELAMFDKGDNGGDMRLDPLCADFALAGAAVTRVPRQAEPVVVTQNLRVEKTTGFESFGPGARFAGTFAQQADEPIVMEAELATSLALRDGHTPGADPQASGGGYIHYVASGAWKFTVKTPGKYNAWERASFPWAGGWNHTETMDGKQSVNSLDSTKQEDGWKWVKAGTYDLSAGPHSFQLSYEAGARLDVIVLSRSDQPPDVATLGSSYVGPTAGEIWTAPVKPFDVAQWQAVHLDVAGKTAAVTEEYSTDGGKSWTGFTPGGTGVSPVSAIKPAGGGADTLQFHLKIAGVPGQALPFFTGGTVNYVAGPHNVRYLENARVRIGIDPYGVASVYDKRAGRSVAVAPETHDALIMLVTKPAGNAPTTTMDLYSATLDDFSIGGTADTPVLTMKHSLPNGIALTSTVKLLPSGQSEWQLKIDNHSSVEVCEVRYPVITGVALGDPTNDWIMVPKCWGQVWKNPGADHLLTYWGTSMRWMQLWDNQSGLYLGIEDPKFEDWAFVYGGDRSGGITMAAHQRILARAGGSWQSGVYRYAVTGGDWHDGGDIYRAYVASALKPCEHPAHVQWLLDAWVNQASNDAPFIGWDMVITPYDPIPGANQYLVAANRQMMDGMDAGYCGLFPYPAVGWGTTREFSQKLGILRALGGMYTPYHNNHLYTPAFGHYKRIGVFPKAELPKDCPQPDDDWYHRGASYAYDGSYEHGETDYFGEYDMGMGSQEWRDWMYDWTQRYLTWGADGMYYDQFNMIYPNGRLYPDFETYGCWAPGIVRNFSKMVHDSRARDLYYTSSGEFCCDVYGQWEDMGMGSGVWNRDDLWYYCNPHDLLIDGGWNGGLRDEFGGYERERFIWQTGARFEQMVGPKQNGDQWRLNLLGLRTAVKSLIYDSAATFRDTVGLTITGADGKTLGPQQFMSGQFESGPFRGQCGRWFLFKKDYQRAAVINFINMPTVAGAMVSFSTKETGPIKSAVCWTMDGKKYVVPGKQQGDVYNFPLPESECSTMVLVGTPPREIAVISVHSILLRPVVTWNLTGPATFGSRRSVALTVTNCNPIPMYGTATMRLPAGWPAAAPVKFGPLAPGESADLQVPFTVGEHATKGRVDIWCDVNMTYGPTFSTYSFITVNDPVLIDFRGNPGDYYVWLKNLSTQPVTGTVALSAPAPLQVSCAPTFGVTPESEAKIPVTVTGRDGLKQISEMLARVTIGGKTTEVVRGVMPSVDNGDFEADGAGDGEPDWWMARKVRDDWAYERKHLSTDAHGGKYCLQVDPPQEGEKFIRVYPVNGCLAPHTKYKVSVWIKAEQPRGVYLYVNGLTVGANQTTPEWKQFTADLTTGADPTTGGWEGLWAYNESPGKAWFDDIVIQEEK